jgi:hypothetical protein
MSKFISLLIYFKNFNGKIIKNVCEHYFKITHDIDDNFEPNITNSMIIKWVINLKDNENGYDIFMDYKELWYPINPKTRTIVITLTKTITKILPMYSDFPSNSSLIFKLFNVF